MNPMDKIKDLTPKQKNVAVKAAVVVGILVVVWVIATAADNNTETRAPARSTGAELSEMLLTSRSGADLDDARLRVRLEQYERQLDSSQDQTRDLISRFDTLMEEREASQAEVSTLREQLDVLSQERAAHIEVIEQLSNNANATRQEITVLENAFMESLQDRDQRAGLPVGQDRADSDDGTTDRGTPPERITEETLSSRTISEEESVNDGTGRNIFERRPGTAQDNVQSSENGRGTTTTGSPRIITHVDASPRGADADRDHDPRAGHYITPGSILSGVLVTGLDASTSAGARRDTTPALMRIQDTALMANLWQLDIRECMALVTGYGSISDERAHLTGDVLTCITEDGDVIEAPLPGYVSGTDGSEGVRGRLVMNQGRMIRRASLAAFSESLATVFGQAFTNIPEGIDSTEDMANILGAAGAAGMGNSFARLADYWIEMAESVSPVIEVKAGVPVQFITTGGIDLRASTTSTPTPTQPESGEAGS